VLRRVFDAERYVDWIEDGKERDGGEGKGRGSIKLIMAYLLKCLDEEDNIKVYFYI
jgi:hypothetical protein